MELRAEMITDWTRVDNKDQIYHSKCREEISQLVENCGQLGHGITLLRYTGGGTQASISV